MTKIIFKDKDNNIIEEKDMTAAEQKAHDDEYISGNLEKIRNIRDEALKESDKYALADFTMTDEMKDYRKNLRDIPTNFTTKEDYKLLLVRDDKGQLTHSIWSKP